MKGLLGIVLGMSLVGLVACEKKLDTDIKRASYAIGQQIGTNLKSQQIDFDAEVVAMALADAKKGDSKLDQAGMQEAMNKLQELAMAKQQEEANTNLKKGTEYLEANKSKEGVKTTASGLQYIVVKEGTGAMPGDDDTVVADYEGFLTSGEKFDSSKDRGQPAEFPVRGVIPGWTEALKMMKVGAQYKLFIPPGLAYGSQGRPGIPANSVLVFDVELKDVKKAKPAKK